MPELANAIFGALFLGTPILTGFIAHSCGGR